MELIIADNLTKSYGGSAVLDSAAFRILAGDAVGLVGPNGTGKTTLVKILAGLEVADSGRLDCAPHLPVGYVEQVPTIAGAETIADLLLREVKPAQAALAQAEAELAAASEESLPSRLAAYQRASDRFEATGGYQALDRGLALLSGLGLEADPGQQLATLSGGEISLLCFAQALVGRPRLLILDEPGNHLDYLGLAWLEQFLKAYQEAFLVISHNRFLLDAVCRKIWHLEAGKLTCFTGNYTQFRAERERERAEREHDYRANDRKARDLSQRVKELTSIASSQNNPPAQVVRKLGAAKRKLERTLETRGERPQAERKVGVDLGDGASRADIALSFDGLDLRIGDRMLLEGGSLHVSCGERVALVGKNGCGKSTLLERIVTEGGWSSGPIRIGPSLSVGYLSQTPHFAHPDATLVEEVRSWGPLSVDQAFGLLSPFLFGYEDLRKPLRVLSGGEQNRLQFARLVYQGASFLILDEPTNHMDIPSRESIEAALAEFRGTLLVVSHDRYFLNGIVERVVEFRERRLVSHPGDFSDFFSARYPTLPPLSGELGRRGAERRRETHERAAPSRSEEKQQRPGKPSTSGERRARPAAGTDWEATIERLEAELAKLETRLAEEAASGRRGRSSDLERRIALLRERIERAYQNWSDAQE